MQQPGSETLSTEDTSQEVTLTSDQYAMLEQTISFDIISATFSRELEDGPSPSDSRDGPKTDLFGQVVAPVSRFRGRGKCSDSMTRATSGHTGLRSSASVGLQSFLENRLKARLPGCGLTLFTLTWKQQVTPSGREYFLLRASAPRNDGTGLGSWQTPTTRDGKGESGKGNRTKRGRPGKPHVANLCDQLVDLGRRDLVRSSEFRNHLMGYPICWEDAAPTATRSSRKSRPNSSVRP